VCGWWQRISSAFSIGSMIGSITGIITLNSAGEGSAVKSDRRFNGAQRWQRR
jgi:hypothetical protein